MIKSFRNYQIKMYINAAVLNLFCTEDHWAGVSHYCPDIPSHHSRSKVFDWSLVQERLRTTGVNESFSTANICTYSL